MNTTTQTAYGMPIYNLQQMLRAVFQVNGMMPEIVPDGIFDEVTEEAVKVFQKANNLTPTGVADNETWDLLTEAYAAAQIAGNPPVAVNLFAYEDFAAASGEPRARLWVLQAMMQVMHLRFANLPQVQITGIRDAQTDAALSEYRSIFGLPKGEGIDNQLWYHFAKAYESAVLPHDFENPQNNRFKPEEARQQVDLSRRSEKSMSESMGEEIVLPQLTDNAPISRRPMLDSYQSLRDVPASSEAETKTTAQPPKQPRPMQSGRQGKPPMKWNF